MKIKPLTDRVLLKRIEEKEVARGGIIIPDTAKEKPQEAEVVALGDGKLDDNGKRVPMTVEAGIIDPAKVTRSAPLNEASIAGLPLLTEALVAEIPDERKDAMPGGDRGGMDGLY